MQRRGFVGSCIAGLAGFFGATVKEVRDLTKGYWLGDKWVVGKPGGYLYDWTTGYTDDPDWQGRLVYGLRNHTYINGVEMKKSGVPLVGGPRKIKTGSDGWVEYVKYNVHGCAYTLTYDDWNGGKLAVDRRTDPPTTYLPRKLDRTDGTPLWQQYDPFRVNENGERQPRWREELAIGTIRGYVEYVVDADTRN